MNQLSNEMFSQPENDARIMQSWDRFLNNGNCPPDALRCLVEDSWRRCLADQVDPRRHQAPEPISANSLASLHHECAELLDVSRPVMADARDFLSETGTFMVLTDQNGTVISLEGDPRTRDPAEHIHLIPGANWSEPTVGTNAIGTALALRRPVQIHSAEHFCEGIKRWTCSATIIRDPIHKQVLGAIDVSGLNKAYSRHSLALVVTAANRIESLLARKETQLRYQLLEKSLSQLSRASDGVIIVDRHGFPIKANEDAAQLLTAFGFDLRLAGGQPIAGLSAPFANERVPEWLRQEWIEPVTDGGQRIGSVITMPVYKRRCTGVAAAAAAKRVEISKGLDQIIGRHPKLTQAVQKAEMLAKTPVPVLLLGETGVGKELFAQGIHQAGPAPEGPFVALNCGGLSRELLASELFGYVEGAFTGARRGGMIGKIEAANGGTLFLDELGEMPIDLQPHFLRVLEEGQIYRLGENAPRQVKFRLVAATNRDLRMDISQGKFRMDLYYRISVTSINIPPLRDRKEDLPLLMDHYLHKLARLHGVPAKAVDPEIVSIFQAYHWPGNVRELRNVLESLLLMGSDPNAIQLEDLPFELTALALETAPIDAPSSCLKGLKQAEQQRIRESIAANRGNLTSAARDLGIAKSTLYMKLKKYQLDDVVVSVRDR